MTSHLLRSVAEPRATEVGNAASSFNRIPCRIGMQLCVRENVARLCEEMSLDRLDPELESVPTGMHVRVKVSHVG
jgi:hypothetical protein